MSSSAKLMMLGLIFVIVSLFCYPDLRFPLCLLIGILCGGVPFGYYVYYIKTGRDIRMKGSGNLGMTNVLRLLGLGPGVAVFILDTAKGFVPTALANWNFQWLGLSWGFGWGQDWAVIMGIFCVLGHTTVPWLKGSGGRGVATSLGLVLGVDPLAGLIAFGLWVVVTFIVRRISAASILAAIELAIYESIYQPDWIIKIVLWLAAGIILIMHVKRVGPLLFGKEPPLWNWWWQEQEIAVDGVCGFLVNTPDDSVFFKRKLLKAIAKKPKFWPVMLFAMCIPHAFMFRRIRPLLPLKMYKMGYKIIELLDGRKLKMEYQGVPRTPEEMMDASLESACINEVERAVRLCIECGATVVGLGAYTSIAGNHGEVIAARFKNEKIILTSGDGVTAETGVQAVVMMARETYSENVKLIGCVVGAGGNTGSAAAQLLARFVNRIYLVGRKGGSDINWVADAINSVHGKGKAIVTSLANALKSARMVITVTSETKELDLAPEMFRKGTHGCDIARPRDVSEEVALARKDVLFTDGGVVRVFKHIKSTFSFGFPDDEIYACMAETFILLAMGVPPGSYSIGKGGITVKWLDQLRQWFDQLGFKVVGARRFDKPLPPEAITDFIHAVATNTLGMKVARVKGGRECQTAV